MSFPVPGMPNVTDNVDYGPDIDSGVSDGLLQNATASDAGKAVGVDEHGDPALIAAGGADPEVIAEAVEDYLDEHGVTVTETDPTVPSWAKAAQKPTYTAQEVGAYEKPSGGIPATDLAQAVQTSLGKADGAIQNPTDGTAGQVLKKTASGVEWANESGGGGSGLPAVTSADAGKVLTVDSGGEWGAESPFVQLDYLESDGQSYIDTGINADYLADAVVDFQLASAAVIEKAERQYVFGTYSGASPNVDSRFQYYYGGSYKNNGNNVFGGFGNQTNFSSVTPDASRHSIALVQGKLSLDQGTAADIDNDNFTAPRSIYLFACNTPDGVKYLSDGLRIYSAKIYIDSGELALDLIPVRVKATGAVGMYDKVSGAFFPMQAVTPAGSLPDTTSASAGDVLTLSSGKTPVWQAAPAGLPAVTASNNGDFLRVVNGAWEAQTVPAAENNSFGGGS